MAQSENSLSNAKLNMSMVTTRKGGHYMLSFVPTPRSLKCQILCRLYKSPLDGTINQGSPVCIHVQTDHIRTLKNFYPCHNFSQVNAERTQCVVVVSESSKCCTLHGRRRRKIF